MILPSKHLREHRSLLSIGARILERIRKGSTVSSLWDEMRSCVSTESSENERLSFDWFILALDFLYIAGAIELQGIVIRRVRG